MFIFCFYGRGTFVLAALVNEALVVFCEREAYLGFVLKVKLQVGSQWESESRFPAAGVLSGAAACALFALELDCLVSHLGFITFFTAASVTVSAS